MYVWSGGWRLLLEQGDSQEWRAGYYESMVTHKSFIGDELIGGKTVMKLNNIHISWSHTYS